MKKIFLIALISFCAQFSILSSTVATCKPEESKTEYCICGSKEMLIKMLSLALRAHFIEIEQAYTKLVNSEQFKTIPETEKLKAFYNLRVRNVQGQREIFEQLEKLVNDEEANEIYRQTKKSVQNIKKS